MVTEKRRPQPPSATTRPRTKKALAPTRPPLLALGGGLLRDDGRGLPSACEVVVVCGLRCGWAVGPAGGRLTCPLRGLPSLRSGGGCGALDAHRSPSATPPKHLRSRTAGRGGGCLGGSGASCPSYSKTFFKKKPSGCLGVHFSPCIRCTSSLNFLKVGWATSPPFERSTRKLQVASVMPYCMHTWAI